jgi:TatA/E family protein of Tat protein translocase
LTVILVIVLVVFGPGKLPSLGSALGRGLKNFKKATQEVDNVSEEARQLGKIEVQKPLGSDSGTTSCERRNA